VRSEKIVLMEHGIDRVTAPGSLAKAALHTRFRIHESQQIVLFFGHMAHYKGLDLLIEAFKSLPSSTNAVLLVAGYCRNAVLRMQIRTELEPLLSAGRAFWLDGYVPDDEVLPIFQGSDMLVMPYRHIDQSGVVFMAMSTGLPVLATDVGSLAEYAVLTGGRVVPPEDHLALAAAISDMLPAAAAVNRQRVADAARRYLWSNVVRALLPTYANLT
jgi:glycosyltransferase involved in cell wall biosynthesis